MSSSTRFGKTCLITAIVITISCVICKMPFQIELSEPTQQHLDGFDIYDLVYCRGKVGLRSLDADIVVVQIEDSREKVAKQLTLLQKWEPAVLGLDALFEFPGDPISDSLLQCTVAATRCVTATALRTDNKGGLEMIPTILNKSTGTGRAGFINFYVDKPESEPVIRAFPPIVESNRRLLLSFSASIVKQYSPEMFNKLIKRSNKIELINYSGNQDHYYHITADELNRRDASTQLQDKVRGKIVLLGYFSPVGSPVILDDLHFTPLNKEIAGKSLPDMYGVTIHANIISMALQGSYITEVSDWISFFIAALLVFSYTFYEQKDSKPTNRIPESVYVLFDLVLISTIIWMCLLLFEYRRLKVPLEPLLVAFAVKKTHKSIVATGRYIYRFLREAAFSLRAAVSKFQKR